MIIFLTLNSSIRYSWPLPPSYILFPSVPMSLHSCFFLLSFFVFLCQLFLLYLIIKWCSSGLWSTCIFAFALLWNFLSLQKNSFNTTRSKFLPHWRFSSNFQTNSYRRVHLDVPHHIIFAFKPGSLPDFHITVNVLSPPALQANKTETSESFQTPLVTHSFSYARSVYSINKSLPFYLLKISQIHPPPRFFTSLSLLP